LAFTPFRLRPPRSGTVSTIVRIRNACHRPEINLREARRKYDYREAAPHLILQAFLQRVVNLPAPSAARQAGGGARIDREFALGRQRLDLCVRMGANRYPVELKVREARRSDPASAGIEQLGAYMDACGAREGWLVIFDRRPDIPWDQRIGWKTVEHGGRTIHIVDC
jgi:hypothetical protein